MSILSGWKEIANHLHQGVRTVQRWERIGLPIHRLTAGRISHVIAFAEELDAWAEATPTRNLDLISALTARVEELDAEVRSLRRENGDLRKSALLSPLLQRRGQPQYWPRR